MIFIWNVSEENRCQFHDAYSESQQLLELLSHLCWYNVCAVPWEAFLITWKEMQNKRFSIMVTCYFIMLFIASKMYENIFKSIMFIYLKTMINADAKLPTTILLLSMINKNIEFVKLMDTAINVVITSCSNYKHLI